MAVEVERNQLGLRALWDIELIDGSDVGMRQDDSQGCSMSSRWKDTVLFRI